MQANWLSNGLGGQSMFMMMLAAQKEIPATVSITADTGSENDRICSTGERMGAPEFFERYVKPYAEKHGIEAVFVRAVDKERRPLPSVMDTIRICAAACEEDAESWSLSVPMFTNGRTRGQLTQTCTSRWKLAAIYQEARRRKIKSLRCAIGYHAMEGHRIKAKYLCDDGGYSVYKPQIKRGGTLRDVQWLEHYYPCIDLGLDREGIRARLEKARVPYLKTTECDWCPHQDYARWANHSKEVIAECAAVEARFGGKLFFTDRRIPLLEALEEMRLESIEKSRQQEISFGCENGAYCGL